MSFLKSLYFVALYLLLSAPSPDLPDYRLYVPDWTPLHQNVSQLQRLQVVRAVPIAQVFSAPGHLDLRSPEAVRAISEAFLNGTMNSSEAMVLNIVTDVDGIRYIEFPDGNHRAAGMLRAFPDAVVGDLPAPRVLVNGFDTNGTRPARWIPLHIARDAGIPYEDVSSSPFAKGPTAQVDPGTDFSKIRADLRGARMRDVLLRTEQRLLAQRSVAVRSAFLTPADIVAPIAAVDQLRGNIRAAKEDGYPLGASGFVGLLRTVEETRSGFMETANVFVATPVFSTIDFIPGLLGIETAVPKEYSFIRGETTLEKWWNTAGEERDSVMGDNFYLKAPAGGCY